jgi:hypothetical protein
LFDIHEINDLSTGLCARFLNYKNVMAQIGFTSKQEAAYDRFQKMRQDYQDAHGRTYAPGFLTVLMDLWEVVAQLNAEREAWIKANPKSTESFVIEPGDEGGYQLWRVEEALWIELGKPILEPENE